MVLSDFFATKLITLDYSWKLNIYMTKICGIDTDGNKTCENDEECHDDYKNHHKVRGHRVSGKPGDDTRLRIVISFHSILPIALPGAELPDYCWFQ